VGFCEHGAYKVNSLMVVMVVATTKTCRSMDWLFRTLEILNL